jgi:hypothetical protein
MKFKLPRQNINQDLAKIISREVRKQDWLISRVSKKNLMEIVEVSKAIAKDGLPKYLVCKKLSKDLGHGIFLHPEAEPIIKGQVIALYAGEVSVVPKNDPEEGGAYAFTPVENMVLTKEEQIRFTKKYRPRCRYSFKVDALKKGNFTRFINHSEKPNVEARTVYIPRNSLGLAPFPAEVLYIAKKTIRPGEQLLVCYEEGENCYWIDPKIKPFSMTSKTFLLDSKLRIRKS